MNKKELAMSELKQSYKFLSLELYGAVALISAQLLFLCKKITARPRKNPAVGVKSSYATN
jgi:hypothetical protein